MCGEKDGWTGCPIGSYAGQQAADYWAAKAANATNPVAKGTATVMGTFASLWTPQTATKTGLTLAAAGVADLALSAVGTQGAGVINAPAGPAGLLTSAEPAGLLSAGESGSVVASGAGTAVSASESTGLVARVLTLSANPFVRFAKGFTQGYFSTPENMPDVPESTAEALGQVIGTFFSPVR